MQLLAQPGAGVMPLVEGIDGAKQSVEIVIFRLDRPEIERALANAVGRGVFVHALLADTNSSEPVLRKQEARFLARGVTVTRTADDLVRYHGKMMIIDRAELYVLGFNFTHLDIERSRSFGIVTDSREVVEAAAKVFECDARRQPYQPSSARFLVSPLNARKELAALIQGAEERLLIYDMRISDKAMIRLLEERARAGVDVRIIGRVSRESSHLTARKLPRLRLHVRAMVRDRGLVFVGSQSLRELELDERREIGVVLEDRAAARTLTTIFEQDWRAAEAPQAAADSAPKDPVDKAAKKAAKAIAKELPPVAPVVEELVRQVVGKAGEVELDPKEVEQTVKDAAKKAVREAIKEVVEDVVDQQDPDKAG
jgi:phosphatidylserine/phosphatidylglycerophosphate/cardiolipin synthase-like enzyme